MGLAAGNATGNIDSQVNMQLWYAMMCEWVIVQEQVMQIADTSAIVLSKTARR